MQVVEAAFDGISKSVIFSKLMLSISHGLMLKKAKKKEERKKDTSTFENTKSMVEVMADRQLQ